MSEDWDGEQAVEEVLQILRRLNGKEQRREEDGTGTAK